MDETILLHPASVPESVNIWLLGYFLEGFFLQVFILFVCFSLTFFFISFNVYLLCIFKTSRSLSSSVAFWHFTLSSTYNLLLTNLWPATTASLPSICLQDWFFLNTDIGLKTLTSIENDLNVRVANLQFTDIIFC